MTPLSPAAGGDVERVADWLCVCGCRSYARMDEAIGDTFAPGPHVRCLNCKREHYWPAAIAALAPRGTGAEWVVGKGTAAIGRMLDMIGEPGITDHDLAKVFCDAELDIRAMLASAPSPAGEPH